MAMLPDKALLATFTDDLLSSLDDLRRTADLFKTFEIPDFKRETEYVSLEGKRDYPWIGGRLISTDGVVKEEREYLAMTNEYVTEENTSKHCRLSRDAMAVGALARFNNNYKQLAPEARALAKELGLRPVCHNPFMFNVAQLVECVHVVHDSLALINDILDSDETRTMAEVQPKAGVGVGAVEVPRGILYHEYAYDEEGYVQRANCVIPTTQNHANIHLDVQALAAEYAGRRTSDAEIEKLCSMLVRAYDPCISCSVH
jgi:coenzyme F420-reducing hydrogenase alpha subunit